MWKAALLPTHTGDEGRVVASCCIDIFWPVIDRITCCDVCSPDLPESEASYAITAGGIADAKE